MKIDRILSIAENNTFALLRREFFINDKKVWSLWDFRLSRHRLKVFKFVYAPSEISTKTLDFWWRCEFLKIEASVRSCFNLLNARNFYLEWDLSFCSKKQLLSSKRAVFERFCGKNCSFELKQLFWTVKTSKLCWCKLFWQPKNSQKRAKKSQKPYRNSRFTGNLYQVKCHLYS